MDHIDVDQEQMTDDCLGYRQRLETGALMWTVVFIAASLFAITFAVAVKYDLMREN